MTFPEARKELLELAVKAAVVLNQFPAEQRHTLHGVFADDVLDLVSDESAEALKEAFIQVNRDYWLRENPPPNQLRLVEGSGK